MTIDRTALRGIAAEVHKRNLSAKFGDPRYSCTVGSDELLALVSGVPQLLNELDAKDRRIAELEAACQSVRSGAAEAVAAHDAQVARIAELEARQQELLATIVRLTNETPFPDEIKGWEFQRAKMLTEIGTLRSRVVELETLNIAGARAVDVMDDIGEQARARIDELETSNAERGQAIVSYQRALEDLQLRLSIATELNVNDRKRIAELETEVMRLRGLLPSEET